MKKKFPKGLYWSASVLPYLYYSIWCLLQLTFHLDYSLAICWNLVSQYWYRWWPDRLWEGDHEWVNTSWWSDWIWFSPCHSEKEIWKTWRQINNLKTNKSNLENGSKDGSSLIKIHYIIANNCLECIILSNKEKFVHSTMYAHKVLMDDHLSWKMRRLLPSWEIDRWTNWACKSIDKRGDRVAEIWKDHSLGKLEESTNCQRRSRRWLERGLL